MPKKPPGPNSTLARPTRVCTGCEVEKTLDLYTRNRKKNCWSTHCKPCHNVIALKSQHKRLESRKPKDRARKAWRLANDPGYREYRRVYEKAYKRRVRIANNENRLINESLRAKRKAGGKWWITLREKVA